MHVSEERDQQLAATLGKMARRELKRPASNRRAPRGSRVLESAEGARCAAGPLRIVGFACGTIARTGRASLKAVDGAGAGKPSGP
jgi:hypothetical protein